MSRTTSSSNSGTSSMPFRCAASRSIFSSLRSLEYTIPTRTNSRPPVFYVTHTQARLLAPVFLDGGGEGEDEGADGADLELGAAVGAVEDLAGEGDVGLDAGVALRAVGD